MNAPYKKTLVVNNKNVTEVKDGFKLSTSAAKF